MKVTGLFIHPVKGFRAIARTLAKVVSGGFEHDRRWMITREDGTFLTQRSHPRFALVDTRIEGDEILLHSPDAGSCSIPLAGEGPVLKVRVWNDTVCARHFREADTWISEVAGERARLVWMPETSLRPTRAGEPVSFADAYPFLLVSEASLADLNARLARPIEMRRFRPNIVIDAPRPFAEDELGTFRIGDVTFRSVKPCTRCAVTTIDPETGEAGKEPLRTLSTYRKRDGKVLFGMNLVAQTSGIVRIGDVLA
jgi:hypothetical protein